MATAKVTQDHDEIRKWAEARGGKPGTVAATEKGDDPGMLRIFFPKAPHHNDAAIEEISWDEFFDKFDETGLELHFQEKTADGKLSDFNKLTYPEPDSAAGKRLLSRTKKSVGKKSAGKSASKGAAKTASKSASKKTAQKKAPAKKSATRKTSGNSASKKATSPVRNFPKPEQGRGHSEVY